MTLLIFFFSFFLIWGYLETCSLSCFQDCEMNLEYCIDELPRLITDMNIGGTLAEFVTTDESGDEIMDTVNDVTTSLTTRTPSCDVLTSFLNCQENIEIGGLAFKLENICCDACGK